MPKFSESLTDVSSASDVDEKLQDLMDYKKSAGKFAGNTEYQEHLEKQKEEAYQQRLEHVSRRIKNHFSAERFSLEHKNSFNTEQNHSLNIFLGDLKEDDVADLVSSLEAKSYLCEKKNNILTICTDKMKANNEARAKAQAEAQAKAQAEAEAQGKNSV